MSPAGLNKAQIATVLREISTLMQFRDENPFKVRAFDNAARAFVAEPATLDELLVPGRLEKVKGIGKATADVIRSLAATGTAATLVELRAGAPVGLADLMRIPNLGAKKIAVLHGELGINTLDELEAACRAGRIAECRGFTAKAAEKILAGIEQARRFSGQMLLSHADLLARPLLDALRSCPQVIRAEVAGSLRRRKEIVGDLDFVASSAQPEAVMRFFATHPAVESIIGSGSTKTSVLLAGDVQADLRVVPDEQFATALHHFTGSKEHNTLIRSRALKMNRKVNEYGVYDTSLPAERALPVSTEEELFAALGLTYIPPELREGMGEIEAAERGGIPALILPDDYVGVLHCHTTWSDGKNSVMEMATAARDLHRWQYFAVCDHSEAAAYAGGVKKANVPEQQTEIEEVDAALAPSGFRVLKGTECDILADGEMDYPDRILATMDIVVASVHSRFTLSAAEMTARIIRAMENPYVNIIGHVSGRLLLGRDPYGLHMEKILESAARTRTVMEINADPKRLDLDWRFCKQAKELGVKFTINPDAHSVAGLSNVQYGISMARKGWLTKDDVINCLPLDGFLTWIKQQREWKLEQAAKGWD